MLAANAPTITHSTSIEVPLKSFRYLQNHLGIEGRVVVSLFDEIYRQAQRYYANLFIWGVCHFSSKVDGLSAKARSR
jgi:hypothetical protein